MLTTTAHADALRTIKDAIGDALDEAREADRTCRDEALGPIRDAKTAAKDLRLGNARDIDDLDAVLRKAIRRTKASCPKKVTSLLEDALDALDDLPKKRESAPAPAPAPKPYEPSMDDVGKAKDACSRAVRFRNEEKPCQDATLQVMRGPHRALALQIPQSCSNALRDDVAYCVQMAAKSKKSPIEINNYCVKSFRYIKEIKDCITEWSSK